MEDKILQQKIIQLQKAVEQWMKLHELWSDSLFRAHDVQFEDEPSQYPAVTVLVTEGGLYNMINGWADESLLEEFRAVVESEGFFYELINHYTIGFYSSDEVVEQSFYDYFHWKWICKLVVPDYTDLYSELFDYFGKDHEKLEKLDWRKFEVLISEIFRNQGYRTELGKGSGDGGADVRIFSKDGVFDIVTLVQAKRYRKSLPVKLSAVQALSGLVHTSGAEQGIVATTSRFLPGVHQFAARENSRILLADSNIISEWCKQTQDTMHSARSRLLANDRIVSLANSGGVGAEGRVVVSSFGYNSTDYEFFMVIKEDPRAALLLPLPTIRHYSDTPYNTRGTSIPNLTSGLLDSNSPEKIVRVRKVNNPGEPAWFMTDNYSFLLWDGQPCHFDLND